LLTISSMTRRSTLTLSCVAIASFSYVIEFGCP
jgi:hypothetical protein